jgi:hypothetical protein
MDETKKKIRSKWYWMGCKEGIVFYGVRHRKISRKFSATPILKAIKTDDLSLLHSLLLVLPFP